MEENQNGISVITCSVNPHLCAQMAESVKNTIGTAFETIIFDNREKNLGICQAYNYCASKARFPYLCFVHEDVILPTPNWGMSMVRFAERTPDCGVIGFAGGTTAKKNFMSWEFGPKGRYRYYDSMYGGRAHSFDDLSYKYNNPENEEFAKVITLDGLFLFVSSDVWKERPFDEKRIKGFHFYDADFSFGIAQKRQNYVCLTADIYHFSGGNPDRTYFENARIFQKKWKQSLPQNIGSQKITLQEEVDNALYLCIQSLRQGFTLKESIRHLIEINGVWFILLICMLMPVKIVKKIMRLAR
ncbi:MAG: glycosyltransferase family protein [Spirochaetaceae bacterium]|jgi:hypothetical protein|nr:glycosyltransferase family protein [Spirochaetaceae bacterium]